jgi:hypothetical protein
MDSASKALYYRCYFTQNDHVIAHEEIFCDDDDAAIEKARAILASAKFMSLELWRGAECVAKLDKEEAHSSDDGVSDSIELRNR